MSVTHSPVQTRRESIMPWSTLTWSFDGDIYPSGQNLLGWTAGNLNFSNDASYAIASGMETLEDTEYIYWDLISSGIFQLGSATDCIGNGIVPIGVGIENSESGQDASLRVFQGPGLNITADNIATNTLSAITADMGTLTAGVISGIEIYGSTITGGIIQTGTSGKRVRIDDTNADIRFYNNSGSNTVHIGGMGKGGTGLTINAGAVDVITYTDGVVITQPVESVKGTVTGGAIEPNQLSDTYGVWGRNINYSTSTTNKTVGTYGTSEGWDALDASLRIGILGIAVEDVAGSGTYIGIWGQSDEIALRLSQESDDSDLVDFSVDASGYLKIDPSGNRTDISKIRVYTSGWGSSNYSEIYTSNLGNLYLHANGGYVQIDNTFRLGSISTYTTITSDGSGNLTIDPSGTVVDIVGNLDVSGSYQMDGSDIIDTSGYQVGVLKTRSFLAFGHNSGDSANDTPVTIYPYLTGGDNTGGVANGKGYRMMRAGKITGVSCQFDCTDASVVGSMYVTVYKNGSTATSVTATSPTLSSITDYGMHSTSNSATFNAGDTIYCRCVLEGDEVDAVAVDDIAIIVEVST